MRAYNQLLAEYTAADPPRVVQKAPGRVSCKALPKCDADALGARARAMFAKNEYTRRPLAGSRASRSVTPTRWRRERGRCSTRTGTTTRWMRTTRPTRADRR